MYFYCYCCLMYLGLHLVAKHVSLLGPGPLAVIFPASLTPKNASLGKLESFSFRIWKKEKHREESSWDTCSSEEKNPHPMHTALLFHRPVPLIKHPDQGFFKFGKFETCGLQLPEFLS
uniref:Uncharacterized protein n=1 Tax=Micrurus spixii TaxID=129469 RepID=A0A2D4NIC8_9SAUR